MALSTPFAVVFVESLYGKRSVFYSSSHGLCSSHPIAQGNSKSGWEKNIFSRIRSFLCEHLDSVSVLLWELKLSGINRTHHTHVALSPHTTAG